MSPHLQSIDNLTAAAKDFLQKVITPPLEELGLLVADQVKLWRFQNQVKILNRTENCLKKKGIQTRKVSLADSKCINLKQNFEFKIVINAS